jgi:hypothetical protein
VSTLAVNAVTDANGGNTATINTYTPTESNMMGKNRIINGDMRIDQRNAGAAVTTTGSYPVDRFVSGNSTDGAFSAQQDSSAPAGFVNSVKVTTTTADASLTGSQQLNFFQYIEGTNVSDLAWGTANAKTVTLSFWVRSSLTGTFGGAVRNSAADRAYPFTYAISAADTWEYKTVTIAGDTSGTWLTTTGTGIGLFFALGAGPDRSGTAGAWVSANYTSVTSATSVIGTLNATWYITGVQLEVGSVATPFERRPYGTELALCQRYFQAYQLRPAGGIMGLSDSATEATFGFTLCQQMRSSPTLGSSGTSSNYRVRKSGGTDITLSTGPSLSAASASIIRIDATVASGMTAGQAILLEGSGSGTTEFPITFSAEL